ncbi:MAG: cysteine--tRNA ligase [Propionibacteriaceae bacterium]|nr:cysteine--tRNA ligase [Propionibacteriaceae bacterium]
MTFRLYDSALKRVVPLEPVIPGQVSIYHCGLTVQSAPHLGHIRKEVVFDVLRRWLTHTGYKVKIVANVTDVNDKIEAKAAERGMEWYELAYEVELELHKAYTALGCIPPSYEPRATGHITEMIELIQQIIDNGHAYVAPDGSGDVYFDVKSWPRYGWLSGQRVDEMKAAEDSDSLDKRDPRDFALWKGAKPSDPATATWPSPWGRGRPGWHIECSAMAGKYLGDAFDIHGGGMDLKFPHHENELAQSQAAGKPFAKYWMHNGLVTMSGEKMSKSLGNVALVSEVVKRFPARAVRLYLLAPHYRSVIELSDAALGEATAQLERIDSFLERAAEHISAPGSVPDAFAAAMDEDLGTPQACAVLFDAIREGNRALDAGDTKAAGSACADVIAMLGILGLDPQDPAWAVESGGKDLKPVVDGLVAQLLAERAAAREAKDWAKADAIRDKFNALGVKIEDTPNGVRWSV